MARAAGPLPRTRTSHSSLDVGVGRSPSEEDAAADRAAKERCIPSARAIDRGSDDDDGVVDDTENADVGIRAIVRRAAGAATKAYAVDASVDAAAVIAVAG
mmetsp:Transcript_36623/g.88270  ORF Transcript_36623/g.88270 Transcript_36623/m.88270 type:complete len:101 (+) Transcript_36623:148-450(+)